MRIFHLPLLTGQLFQVHRFHSVQGFVGVSDPRVCIGLLEQWRVYLALHWGIARLEALTSLTAKSFPCDLPMFSRMSIRALSKATACIVGRVVSCCWYSESESRFPILMPYVYSSASILGRNSGCSIRECRCPLFTSFSPELQYLQLLQCCR